MAIPDQYVVLMERTLNENKKLQTTILDLKTQLEKQQPVTQEQSPKTPKTPKTPKSPVVPQMCKNTVRICYKELVKKEDYEGFDLSVMFNDPGNKTARERLIKAVIDANGGRDECPFSKTVIEVAVKQHFHGQKDKKHKLETGKDEAHKVKCRRQGRIRENCKRLKVGLSKKPWSEEKKKRVLEILKPDYMSEEESDFEELDDGRRLLMGYKVKSLPWIHPNVKEIKRSLMKSYLDSLSEFQRSNFRQRQVNNEEPSSKPQPANCPQWVLTGVF